jgi:putative N-acetyltransferase (TIGR04045 family)
MRIEIARTLTELEGYHRLRREVFVDEQHLFEEDDRDGHDAGGLHLVALSGDEVVGVVRCYRKQGGTWFGGRLAVAPSHRTGTVGARLVRRAVEEMERRPEVRRFYATVQAQNERFFIRLGWITRGRPFVLAGHEHRLMEYPLHGRRP